MRIAVIGASGRTGGHVVDQALARGHQVIAVARTPGAVARRDGKFVVRRADVLSAETLPGGLTGAEAVVSALGVGTTRAATDVYSRGVANVLAAMAAAGIERVAVVSAAPAGPRREQPALMRRVVMPVLDRLFGATYDDMRRMEAVLRASSAEWVVLRPPRLVAAPATGAYRVDAHPLARMRRLTSADLATALLDALTRDDLVRRAVYVAN